MIIKHQIRLAIAIACFIPGLLKAQTNAFVNFNEKGEQVTKFSKLGDAIDAHDGEIAYFNGTYYLYGTSYGCGFEWGRKDAPFCGFKAYSSTDMVNWTDKGMLFDASTTVWQTRCNGNTYGCFRPHVVFNKTTGLYVLWINVYDNVVGYRVFTSKSPVGPFVEQAEPKLAVNANQPAAGLNNGDHDLFIDDDGTAYLVFTDWRAKGAIAIEQLSADYLTGTGKFVQAVTAARTEAPALFKRKGIYYVIYSDPNCGYCSGTGSSYKTAKSPLGPWSGGIKISDNSCGGQPSFVSSIKLKTGEIFLYGSDLWNNAAKNESLANYFWAPLTFTADGAINPINCDKTVAIPSATSKKGTGHSKTEHLAAGCDISKGAKRTQVFKATKTGLLSDLTISTFKAGATDAAMIVEVREVSGDRLLNSTSFAVDALGWSPKNMVIHPKVKVIAGRSYAISISSATEKGCYGLEYYLTSKGQEEPKFLYQTTITSSKRK